MAVSIVGNVRHVADEYRRFIKSSYALADDALRAQFERQVDQADVLVKGPYVTLGRDFLRGRRLQELLGEAIGPADLARLKWPFGPERLYAHQERAFRAVEGGRNVVVTTGTGSGKTEAFLLPILSHVLRANAAGVRGTKAILLYPMNALANDQLGRLRTLIRDSGVRLTFALYTGDSEEVAATLGVPLEGHELTRREDIRRSPPDIILTNYKQLEFLLVRRADRPLFTPALRYLVLDELHSYRGALATEIACLIRRLKARCGIGRSELGCIGTSATVSQDAGGDVALAEFAADLFQAPFAGQDIIGEQYSEAAPPTRLDAPALAVPDAELLAAAAAGQDGALERLAEHMSGHPLPEGGDLVDRVQTLVNTNAHVQALRELAREPRTYLEMAEAWRQAEDAVAVLTPDAAGRVVEAFVLLGSIGDADRPPLLRPKLHSFFHGVYDVGLCMNPECRTLVNGGEDHCPRCHAVVRPAVLCRTCGQDFVKVRWDEQDRTQTLPNEEFLSDENTAFIASRLVSVGEEPDEGDAPAADDVGESQVNGGERTGRGGVAVARGRRRATAGKSSSKAERWAQAWVEHDTGRVCNEPPLPGMPGWSRQWVLRGKGNTCPVCKGRYNRGDILTLLRTGVAASVSVLAARHLDHLEPSERKLLVFADNRQEAAHQAAYMSDRQRQFAVRHAIEHIVREAGEGGLGVSGLDLRVLEEFQRLGLAWRRLGRDEHALWKRALRYEVAGEFCRGTLQRVSLENLGLVAVEYEFLDELTASPEFVEACFEAGLPPEAGTVILRTMLDYVRRKRAVAFDFYQQFLDATRAPWSHLAEEPYSLTVAEHERSPQAFMFDRPPAARGHGVSGWTFHALVRDSERGGPGAAARLVRRLTGLGDPADLWTRRVVELLEEHEILVRAPLSERVRQAVGGRAAYQVDPRVLRAVRAGAGYRCGKCRTWRPYRAPCCPSGSVCSGTAEDQRPAQADPEQYYVRLYTEDRPRRLLAREHTAQIAEQDRAERETLFKKGALDVLVCSPTLELGVDIGQLPSILLRNAPPTPANYLQRAGRAGRQLRIGFVSTFCGMGAHDRHCFESPAWLVRGEFRPPRLRLRNERIVQRHARSLALEELNQDFSWLMGDLLADLQDPSELRLDRLQPVLEALEAAAATTQARAAAVFRDAPGAADAVTRFPADLRRTVKAWHEQVLRLHQDFRSLEKIVSTRENDQKRRARQRAYRELTLDPRQAHVLTYLADVGLLPSYQFPTDTFALEPGVADTPTIRRPAWIALFEFAPGNLVYANGHKLKNIRAFFAGGGRRAASADAAGGQVERFCFCSKCGFASRDMRNNCPRCGEPITQMADVALLESFEAEESTQITSAEDARQRLIFDRKEYVLDQADGQVFVHSYDLVSLEYRERARLMATNWGKSRRHAEGGEQFLLCSSCGRHRPAGLQGNPLKKWNDEHARFCSGAVSSFVLGYEFAADTLLLPVPAAYMPADGGARENFARTLGKALVLGVEELLEIEPDEVAFMAHRDAAGGWSLAFYETAPGGAGYLSEVAGQLGRWAEAAYGRLFGHACEKACYRCLKSYRNQFDHHRFDKEALRSFLFALAGLGGAPAAAGAAGGALAGTRMWLEHAAKEAAAPESPIEEALAAAIKVDGRLPAPLAQLEVREVDGSLLTVPDFAYPDQRIAIFCDGFQFHGNVDTLCGDARKRNRLQGMGWIVLTFWGRQILRDPARCVDAIRESYALRSAAQ